MTQAQKRFLVKAAIKVLVAGMVAVWIAFIYTIATSGLPMIRQLLGCMITTMVIFGLLSLGVNGLKHYAATLEENKHVE